MNITMMTMTIICHSMILMSVVGTAPMIFKALLIGIMINIIIMIIIIPMIPVYSYHYTYTITMVSL